MDPSHGEKDVSMHQLEDHLSDGRDTTISSQVEAIPIISNPSLSDSLIPAYSGSKLAYYPFSSIVFLLWTAFTATLIVLLELAAAASTTSIHQPWYYSSLPGLLLTVFAQGHVAVTAMHLSRLAISALHIHGYSPASWAELFWQADRNWQGPIGIVSMIYAKIKMKTKLSFTIIIFATICMIATVTPVLFSRAYPLTTVDVAVQTTSQLNVFWPPQIQAVDAYSQLASGGGAWATGTSVLSVYNSSVFIPAGTARNDTGVNDIFFTGDTLGADAELQGVRTHGQCHTIISGPVDYGTFTNQMCGQLPAVQPIISQNISWMNVDISLAWCTNRGDFGGGMMDTPSSSFASALVWLNTTNGTEVVQGVVMCNVTFSTGLAELNGQNRTFIAFQEVAIYNVTTAQGGEPPLQPIDAALRALDQSVSVVTFGRPAIVTMLGYVAYQKGDGQSYAQPSLDVMVERLWQGAAHMGSAIGLLCQQNGHTYPVTIHVPIAGRTINGPIAKLVWALGALWFVLLLGCTFMFFRPTFGDNLNSYVAARLLVENPTLVDGHCCGSLDENMEMSVEFETVDDSKMKEIIRHVRPGGQGILNRNRIYGWGKFKAPSH